jgi:glycosyltransferase involved in cell wall biosynthesis
MPGDHPTLADRSSSPAGEVPGGAASPARICLLNGTSLPYAVGGAEQQMHLLARALRRCGHEVLVVTYRIDPAWPACETLEGVPIIRTGGLYLGGRLRRRWGLALPHALRELWRQRDRYDIIQVQQTLELGFAAVVAGARWHKPVIARLASSGRTNDLNKLRTHDAPLGRTMARAVLRSSATMVGVTARAVDDLRAAGVPDARIRLIPNGVDVDRYATARADAPDAPIRRVVCVARLEPVKGVDVLVRAWAQVLAALPDATLRIVGRGSQRAALAALVRHLGIDPAVELVGDAPDVRPYLAQAQLYVLPSRSEGMPNALLEAMASGLSCVATRVGACPELIADGVTGYLAAPEDPDALARALLTAMRDPVGARACAQAASAHIRERYSLEAAVRGYEQLYAEAMAGTRLPHARPER